MWSNSTRRPSRPAGKSGGPPSIVHVGLISAAIAPMSPSLIRSRNLTARRLFAVKVPVAVVLVIESLLGPFGGRTEDGANGAGDGSGSNAHPAPGPT